MEVIKIETYYMYLLETYFLIFFYLIMIRKVSKILLWLLKTVLSSLAPTDNHYFKNWMRRKSKKRQWI